MNIWSKLACVGVVAPFIALTLIGLILFWDAPLKLHDGIVTGKLGRIHTMEEYHRFHVWERCYIIFGSAFAVIAIAGVIQRSIAAKDPTKRCS
jgi:uncharacterized membrane protein